MRVSGGSGGGSHSGLQWSDDFCNSTRLESICLVFNLVSQQAIYLFIPGHLYLRCPRGSAPSELIPVCLVKRRGVRDVQVVNICPLHERWLVCVPEMKHECNEAWQFFSSGGS